MMLYGLQSYMQEMPKQGTFPLFSDNLRFFSKFYAKMFGDIVFFNTFATETI